MRIIERFEAIKQDNSLCTDYGEGMLYRAYLYGQEHNIEKFIVRDIYTQNKSIVDFIQHARENNINTFYIAEESVALMTILFELQKAGAMIGDIIELEFMNYFNEAKKLLVIIINL